MTDPHFPTSGNRPEERRTAPEALRLRSLMPSLTVDDLEASMRFYVDGLGFTVHERWEREGKLQGVMLIAGTTHLGISQDDWGKGRDRQKGVGLRVWAETAQDLDALAARLDEHGIEHDGPKTEPWGARSLSVTDPDGFNLSFMPPQAEGG